MKTWLKRAAYLLITLVVIFIGLLIYLVATFDANLYKAQAIEWVKINKNRTLVIDGPVSIHMFPRLQLKAEKVELSEVGIPQTFAAVNSAQLSLEIWPLLSQKVVIDQVALDGVKLRYRRNLQGVRNFDDLLQKEPSNSDSAMQLDIAKAELNNIEFDIHDVPANIEGKVRFVKLHTGRLVKEKSSPIELEAEINMKQPQVQGTLSGKTDFTLTAKGMHMAGADLTFKGNASGLRTAEVKAQGSLMLNQQPLQLQADDFKVSVTGAFNDMKIDSSQFALKSLGYDPSAKTLKLQKATAEGMLNQQGRAMTFKLLWPALDLQADKISSSAISGEFTRADRLAPVKVLFKTDAPTGNFDALRLPNMTLTVEQSGKNKVHAWLKSNATLMAEQSRLSLADITAEVKTTLPNAGEQAINLNGQAELSAQRMTWDLQGQWRDGRTANNRLTTEGQLQWAERMQVNAKLGLGTLNLDALMGTPANASAAKDDAAPAASTPGGLWAWGSAIENLSAEVRAQVTQVIVKKTTLSDVQLHAKTDGRTLDMPSLTAQAWGGTLKAQASASPSARKLGVSAQANNIEVAQLLTTFMQNDAVRGKGDFSADLITSGNTVPQLKSSLQGKAQVSLRNGAIRGINLSKVMRQAQAAMSMNKDALQKANEVEETDFSQANASFDITQGVARNRDFVATAPFIRLSGEGTIDIGRSNLDYLVRAAVTDASGGKTTTAQQTTEFKALKGLQVPVRLSGPFDTIQYQVQWSQVDFTKALQNKVADKLQERLGLSPKAGTDKAAADNKPRVEDKLKEKLKGLFK